MNASAPPASAWHPHGLAIRDCFAGDRRATVTAYRSDGAVYPMPVRVFFRTRRGFPPLERLALAECRGRVLDIGAGAGCHALALQQRGLEVTAVDVSRAAVRVMRERGVQDARVADVFRFNPNRRGAAPDGQAQARNARRRAQRARREAGAPYDTLLLLMNGIAIVGTLAGLRRFLRRVRPWIPADGRVLLDSMDLRRDLGYGRAALARSAKRGRYFGEIRYAFEYRGRRGPAFPTLFVDPRTLLRVAARAGWRGQVLYEEADGSYLARLSPAP